MYSAVTGWMASFTAIFKTSAEQEAVNRKSAARQQAAWQTQSCSWSPATAELRSAWTGEGARPYTNIAES